MSIVLKYQRTDRKKMMKVLERVQIQIDFKLGMHKKVETKTIKKMLLKKRSDLFTHQRIGQRT